MKKEKILRELKIEGEVLNIYHYGSHVYGTNTPESDHDFIIVMKAGILDSGGFKDNAISNEDESIQGVVYSRGGFQDAINNYEIGALECLFLHEDQILQAKWPYKLTKLVHKDMAKKIISRASNQWHIAKYQYTDGEIGRAKKGIWHAMRILIFGIQLKENSVILDYGAANDIKKVIDNDKDFNPKKYLDFFNSMRERLKTK